MTVSDVVIDEKNNQVSVTIQGGNRPPLFALAEFFNKEVREMIGAYHSDTAFYKKIDECGDVLVFEYEIVPNTYY